MKVYIKPEVRAEIMFHVNKSDVEVSGLGRIQKSEDGSLVVTKVYLLDQENASASTDIDPNAVADLLYQTREDKGDLNFWWHSHVNMGVFWSKTDMDTIEEFGKNGYLLSTVFNKKDEFKTSYFQGANDFLPSVFVDDIETCFDYSPTKEQLEAWEKDHEEKCKEVKFKYSNYYKYWDRESKTYRDKDEDETPWSAFNTGDATYSGLSDAVLMDEALVHLEFQINYNDMGTEDQLVWWDIFFNRRKKNPTGDPEVRVFYDSVADKYALASKKNKNVNLNKLINGASNGTKILDEA